MPRVFRSRSSLVANLALAAVFLVLGLFMMFVPRDAVVAFANSDEIEVRGAVRFIGFLVATTSLAFVVPPLLTAHAPGVRTWFSAVIALFAFLGGAALLAAGHFFAACTFAAAGLIALWCAPIFSIWRRPDEVRFRAVLPRSYKRLLREPVTAV